MPRADHGTLTAIGCLLATMVGWGCIPVFLRHFTGYLDAWTVNALRYSVGALFWLPFVVVLHRRRAWAAAVPPGRSVWRDALLPTSVNVLGQVGYAVSPYFIPASSLGFVLRLSFAFTVLFGFLFLAEERRLARQPAFWLGVAVSLGGLAVMFLDKLRAGSAREVLGIVICAATTVGWGAYAVSVRICMAPYPIRLSFGVISLYTAAVLLLLVVVAPNVPAHPLADLAPADGLLWRTRALGRLGPRLWCYLVGTAFVGIAMGHVLYYRGIRRLGPVVASGVLLGTPFVTLLVAWLALDERMAALELAGGLAVVLGGACLIRARARLERLAPAAT